MSEYPIYRHAPITEALLDIRCALPDGVTLDNIEGLHEHVKDRFPEKGKRFSIEATFTVPSGEAPEEVIPEKAFSSQKEDGFIFRTAENARIFQARLDGFTFNKLKPYENWDVFSSEAKQLWDIYLNNIKPLGISRLALRYINKVLIPIPIRDFKDYLLTAPEIAPGLPQGIASFFTQLMIPFPESNATAIINETMEPPTENNKLPLIFDVDVFTEGNFNPYNGEIWTIFEKLRVIKNDIFMKTFTDKAKELFS